MTDYTPEELEAQEIIPQGWTDPEVTRIKQEHGELLKVLGSCINAVEMLLDGPNPGDHVSDTAEDHDWAETITKKARELIKRVEK